MAIDDPFDAVARVFPSESDDVADAVENVASVGLAAASAVIPIVAVPGALLAVYTRMKDGKSFERRTDATLAMLVERVRQNKPTLERLTQEQKTLAVRVGDLEGAVRIGLFQDGISADDAKRERFISVIAHAAISETEIADLTGFIKNIDELNEQDIATLRAINTVMNKPGDWADVRPNQAGLHPNTFIQRRQELGVAIARNLGRWPPSPGGDFSREEGLGICLRLQGFGLAEVLDTEARSVPRTDYAARLTPRGMMLLKLLGDDVANWERYFDGSGPL